MHMLAEHICTLTEDEYVCLHLCTMHELRLGLESLLSMRAGSHLNISIKKNHFENITSNVLLRQVFHMMFYKEKYDILHKNMYYCHIWVRWRA